MPPIVILRTRAPSIPTRDACLAFPASFKPRKRPTLAEHAAENPMGNMKQKVYAAQQKCKEELELCVPLCVRMIRTLID